jgi:putative nucleotidyltransferase with HDIG domain
LLAAIAAGDNFISYFGVPLINKGKVSGVLEVFHRTTLEPDTEWFDFLNSLAGQAAIAIENASLYESQQRTYQELTLAYDATIEGWSHALDLRDKETEGHSLRVTDLTLKLAGAFGLNNDELIQMRWGALLHDIGKMGVPDGILLKPGPLTDEEWVVMRKHPSFAYEMLSPIHYLRQALDIPYSHHEKWDGSGYPQGLKGKQIPLSARIFAVVDVWDALRSDRPYRSAWSDEKAYNHIRSLSGTHFDPQVVEKFFLVLG